MPRESLITAGWVVAGLCVTCMMQLRSQDSQGAIEFDADGRRLAGSEYDQALRPISVIFSQTAAQTGNGLSGMVQILASTGLVLVLGSLAAGAGVGGGGLFVPIYMVLLGAGPKGAVPLSKATILGGAVGNFISLGFARHPKAKTHKQGDRPMIDYEASTFMQSGELLGVVFGVLLNGLLPAICIVGFLVCILTYNAYKTFRKAFSARAKETKAMAKAAAAAEAQKPTPEEGQEAAASAPPSPPPSPPEPAVAAAEVEVTVVQEKGSSTRKPPVVAPSEVKADFEVTPELAAILAEDAKQFPLWAWALLAPMTGYTLVYSIIKNAIRNDPGCSPAGFWIWYVTPVPVLGGFMWMTAIILGKRHKRKVAAGYPYLPADIQWDNRSLRRFPITALLAGVTAGLLGIGGGMVIGPLFLAIGMEPQVGTSSCAFMILWTAFSGVVIYGVDSHLGAELACWCVAFGIISGQLGQRLVNTVLKKTGRPSYVVFLLASIIGAACVAMTVTLIVKMAQGDYDANDVIEPNESVATHLFYLGTGFGCKGAPVAGSNVSASGSS